MKKEDETVGAKSDVCAKRGHRGRWLGRRWRRGLAAGWAATMFGCSLAAEDFTEIRHVDDGDGIDAPPPDPGSSSDAGMATPPEAIEPDPATPEPPETPPAPPETPFPRPRDIENGCSIVQYCFAYQVDGSSDEERCQYVGCEPEEAIEECKIEIPIVCGADALPPWIFVIPDNGTRYTL